MSTVKIAGRPSLETPGTPKIEDILVTNGSVHTNITSLVAGENQPLDLLETSSPGTYVSGVGVTTGVNITLGSPGAAGNKIHAISIFNGSGQPFTACTLRDGDTLLDWLSLGMATLANGAFAVWEAPSGAIESKNGPFNLRILCTGTMAGIKWGAVVSQ